MRARVLQQSSQLDAALSPVALMERAGRAPDLWQRALLEANAARMLLLCARQTGKSTVAAALALAEALSHPPALVLLFAKAERQSKELLLKVQQFHAALGYPLAPSVDSSLHLTLANGSRILALPANDATVRGFSDAALIVQDEAAYVPDQLFYTLLPMLSPTGRMIAMSTPQGARGWFHQEYTAGGDDWRRVKITVDDCPRFWTPAKKAEARAKMPDREYRQECLCEWADPQGAIFSFDDIQAALRDDVLPLWPTATPQDQEETCLPLWQG